MRIFSKSIALLFAGLAIVSCSSDNKVKMDNDPMVEDYTFEITLQNVTHNQPLSPFTGLSHSADVSLWTLGERASIGLEHTAESGDNTMLLADTTSYDVATGEGVVMPGAASSVMVKTAKSNYYLSIISMLVNTNDAFTGLNQYDVSRFAVGDTKTMKLPVYDAGTEGNSELASTLPGPVSSGEGFNAARDDVDFIARHSGIVSKDDGLMQSALDESHRFDGVVAIITIERVK